MSRRRRRLCLFSAGFDIEGGLVLLEGGDGFVELEGDDGFVALEQKIQYALLEADAGMILLEGSLTDKILLE